MQKGILSHAERRQLEQQLDSDHELALYAVMIQDLVAADQSKKAFLFEKLVEEIKEKQGDERSSPPPSQD